MMCKEIIKCSGQTRQAYQRGPKGAKMTNLSVFDNFGPSGPFLIISDENLSFAPKHLCQTLLCPFGAKNSFLSELIQKDYEF